MHLDEPRARIAHRGSAMSQAKHLVAKALVILGGTVMLVSAFMVSMIFVAIGMAVVLIFGGYLWWKTRDLRKQLRARMQEHSQPAGRVIEGEVISNERTRR
jgi:O-antigen/teichoic acid export membrane protein